MGYLIQAFGSKRATTRNVTPTQNWVLTIERPLAHTVHTRCFRWLCRLRDRSEKGSSCSLAAVPEKSELGVPDGDVALWRRPLGMVRVIVIEYSGEWPDFRRGCTP